MPPLPIIASVFRAAISWNVGISATAVNVMHFSSDTATEATLAGFIDSNVDTGMFDCLSDQCIATTVAITKLDGVSATQIFTLANWHGSQLGTPIPNTAAIISLRTGQRGRSHRGRVFLPGVAEDIFTTGIMSPIPVASAQSSWNTYLTNMAADDASLVVASYKLATASDVTSLLAEAVCGTQRRRQSRIRM